MTQFVALQMFVLYNTVLLQYTDIQYRQMWYTQYVSCCPICIFLNANLLFEITSMLQHAIVQQL